MKKIFSLMLAVVFVFSLTACAGKNKTTQQSSGTSSNPDTSTSSDLDVSTPSDNDSDTQSDSEIKTPTQNGFDIFNQLFGNNSQDSQVTQSDESSSDQEDDEKSEETESTHTHKWQEATCKAPKTCSVCKKTDGKAVDHKYSDGKCMYCGKIKSTLENNQVESKTYASYINYRGYNEALSGKKYSGALSNTYNKIASEKELNVVYFGGSVTYGYGSEDSDQKGSWRVRVGDWFTATFPKVKINNINRAIGDTGSKLGLLRVQRDVIAKKPDLLFIEFSINDLYEGTDYMSASAQFETIIRSVKTALPECDIVTILVTDRNEAPAAHTTETQDGALVAGELHLQAKAHEYISKKYNIPSIHVGRALSDEIFKAGNGVFSQDVWYQYVKDGVHPYNKGYDVYFNVIKEFLVNSLFFGGCEESEIVKQKLPALVNLKLLDGDITFMDDNSSKVSFTTGNGAVHNTSSGGLSYGWADGLDKGIITFPKGSTDTVTVKFTGTDLYMVLISGLTSSASFEVSIDNGATWKKVSYTSKNPVTVLKDLPAKEYTAIIKPAGNNAVSIDCFYSRNAEKATKKN